MKTIVENDLEIVEALSMRTPIEKAIASLCKPYCKKEQEERRKPKRTKPAKAKKVGPPLCRIFPEMPDAPLGSTRGEPLG